MHRIRYAMAAPKRENKLMGTVEADETYIDGKPIYRWKTKRGRGTKKTPVFAVVKRDGDVRTKVVSNVTSKTLGKEIFSNVDLRSRLMTDDYKSYRKIGIKFPGVHFTIEHDLGLYARGDIYTNTIESWFAVLKRVVYGTFHAVSKKHLHRYVSEFEFRWNNRKIDDGERVVAAIKGADGKRLIYREPKEKIA